MLAVAPAPPPAIMGVPFLDVGPQMGCAWPIAGAGPGMICCGRIGRIPVIPAIASITAKSHGAPKSPPAAFRQPPDLTDGQHAPTLRGKVGRTRRLPPNAQDKTLTTPNPAACISWMILSVD